MMAGLFAYAYVVTVAGLWALVEWALRRRRRTKR